MSREHAAVHEMFLPLFLPHSAPTPSHTRALTCTLPMRRLLLLVTLAAMPLFSHAIEEPDYEVIRTFDQV